MDAASHGEASVKSEAGSNGGSELGCCKLDAAPLEVMGSDCAVTRGIDRHLLNSRGDAPSAPNQSLHSCHGSSKYLPPVGPCLYRYVADV